jgi:Putative metallopeptidase
MMLSRLHRWCCLLTGWALLVLGCASTPAPTPTPTPTPPTSKVTLRWVAPKAPEHEFLRQALEASRIPQMVERVNLNMSLPGSMEILFQDKDGPLYDREQNIVFFSYQFVYETRNDLLRSGYCKTEEEALQAAVETAEFVFIHEVAHGLIDLLDIPILGPEEDIADGLAAVAASTIMAAPEVALSTAGSLHVVTTANEPPKESEYWSKHSLNKERFYRILELAYGSDPEKVGPLIRERKLVPEEWWEKRAGDCPKDYEKLRVNWRKVLTPFKAKNPGLPQKL